MARSVRTTKTPEERRAEAETLQATIAEQVEALRTSDAWTRFLEFSRSFHNYSLANTLLILAARPDATRVAGYRTWQHLGRQVRKGETGIRIFGGREIRSAQTDEVTGEETESSRRVFFPVSVFAQDQTDPVDPDAEQPDVIVHRLTGEDPAGIFGAIVDYLTAAGWTVTREPIPGETNGYTTLDGSRRIVIDARLAPAQAAKTALHEAAHARLHADVDGTPAKQIAHRGIQETEAESVAYVTAGILGLETSAYSIGYIAGWSQLDLDVIKDTAARVLTCSHQLADALTGDPLEMESDDTRPSPVVGVPSSELVPAETLTTREPLPAAAFALVPADLNPANLDPANLDQAAVDIGGSGLGL